MYYPLLTAQKPIGRRGSLQSADKDKESSVASHTQLCCMFDVSAGPRAGLTMSRERK